MKALGFVTLAFALSMPMQAQASECKRFTEDQLKVLRDAWFAGADHGYEWTLAAIAWKESSAGENLINWEGPAFGPFQGLLSTVMKREGVSGKRQELRIANRLVDDFDFAVGKAIEELKYWNSRYDGNWNKTVQSYFGGNTPNTPNAVNYRADISNKIRFLRKNNCIHKNA